MRTFRNHHHLLAVAALALASHPTPAHTAGLAARSAQQVPDFSGTWVFADDVTPDRTYAGVRPGWGTEFRAAQTADALTLERGPMDEPVVYRHPFDGSETEVMRGESRTTSTASWQGDRLRIESTTWSPGPEGPTVATRFVRLLWLDGDALMMENAWSVPFESTTLAVYRHPPAEPPAPAPPAEATISAVAWLAGTWPGYPEGSSTTERWGPPAGNAMLGTSETVSNGRMVAFEFLRIVERDGTLLYVAQPGGSPPTEFVLTSISPTRAVFENPEHDFPKLISYTLGEDGILRARIADVAGLRPQEFWYRRDGG